MEDENGVIKHIKNLILNIDPQEVLADIRSFGLDLEKLEDLKFKQDKYIYIEKVANKYIESACAFTMVSGASAGIGGLATGVVLGGADLFHLAAQVYRLNQKIAILHGFDLKNTIHQEKAFVIYLTALGFDAGVKSILQAQIMMAAAENLAKRGPATTPMVKIIMEVASLLGVNMAKTKAGSLVPFIGALIGGGFNYYFVNKTGKAILAEYRSDYNDRWQAQTNF